MPKRRKEEEESNYTDEEDVDEEDEEAEEQRPQKTKKQKTTLTQQDLPPKRGRPPQKKKYEFTKHDEQLIRKGIEEYGTSWASIVKDYFAGTTPKVSSTDLKNFVNTHQNLKSFAKECMHTV